MDMLQITKSLVGAIGKEMEKYGWNQRRLSLTAGFSGAAVSRWFSGDRAINLESLLLIVKAMGLTLTLKNSKGRVIWDSTKSLLLKENEK